MMFRRALTGILLGAGLATGLAWSVHPAYALTSVPLRHVYNGHILSATGDMGPITTSVDLRFSFWTSRDLVSGDVTGTGAINTAASTFAGYAEEHLTITPNSLGYFSVELGSGTPLPAIDSQPLSTLLNEFIQVEVKTAGAANTSYEVLDVNPSDGTIDRSPMLTVPFAQNADFVDQREIGVSSGNIIILQTGAFIAVQHIPEGTYKDEFTIDYDDSVGSGDIILQFGTTLGETLTFDVGTGVFILSDDLLVQGDIESTGALSGSTMLTVSDLRNCDSIDTDATGKFICGTDNATGSGLSVAMGDTRYVNIGGDTMTGPLVINQETGTVSLSASGTIQTESGIIINQDRSGSALIVFGDSFGDAILSFNNTNQYFNFDHDVNIEGDINIAGTINNAPIESFIPLLVSSGGGLNVSVNSGSYRINGTTVNFTGTSGLAMNPSATNYLFFTSTGLIVNTSGFPTATSYIPLGEVVANGSFVTSVTDRRSLQSDDREQTLELVFHPEYAGAGYAASGSNTVGRLSIKDTGSGRNFYSWTSTKPTLQSYDVVLRVGIPPDTIRFAENPLRVSYRSSGALTTDNRLDIEVFDSNMNPVLLSGSSMGLAGTDWQTTQLEFLGSPTLTPGGDFLIRYSLSARSNFQMHLAETRLLPIELRRE